MNQAMPLYKLMILEMLNEVTFPLTNSQITEFLVKYNYATYFEIQETFSELTSTHLIQEETVHHSTRYSITAQGESTLTFYRNLLPNSFLENIKIYLKDNKIALRSKVSVIAGYTPTSDGEYAVQCRILEKEKPIFDMTVLVQSTDMAEQMCFNWEKKQAELYSHILLELLKNPKTTN